MSSADNANISASLYWY